jgi:hypothetical protein
MPPAITLAPETIDRLKSFAEPLVDTFDTVMNRAMDALEALNASASGKSDNATRIFNPSHPPNLSYTTVHSVVLKGKRFPPAETYWNHLLLAMIREAKKGRTPEKVSELIICNNIVGKKEDNGYKYIDEVGISVQGQDANGAWRAIAHLDLALKLPLEVEFSWQDNPKAASPGQRGRFLITP